MRRTLNEVYRQCQKAAEGAGAPAGLDTEVAQATAWLLARGLPAFDALIAALHHAHDPQACCFNEVSPGDPLDAAHKAGALLAPGLVDLLVANAGQTVGQLAVIHLRGAVYLLPAAVQHASAGWCFHFALLGTDSVAFHFRVDPVAGTSIVVNGINDLAPLEGTTQFDVQAHCARAADALPNPDESTTVTLVDATSLAESEARSLASGVEVASDRWEQLSTFAAKVLVPATAESRLRGAGSMSSDNG